MRGGWGPRWMLVWRSGRVRLGREDAGVVLGVGRWCKGGGGLVLARGVGPSCLVLEYDLRGAVQLVSCAGACNGKRYTCSCWWIFAVSAGISGYLFAGMIDR
ncbi:hypothetical protein BJ508DRAFT_82746 [Ascobolus immersus RN42]|uniref:Uncharacterized protein n=1 Tax=Ascobolus immersus RN42 TaxID=1160509 RepID=A0A3N4HE56_ASCIM|nr:hypothetical protein BJ508DRAFT_82746 [Ascobolus immersus RN42]